MQIDQLALLDAAKTAALAGKWQELRELLRLHEEIAQIRDREGATLLFYCCGLRGAETTLAELAKLQASASYRLKSGITPLEKTIYANSTTNPMRDQVELLIAHGADPDTVTSTGWRVLHLAVARGFYDIVRILLEAGADQRAVSTDPHPVTVHAVAGLSSRKNEMLALLAEFDNEFPGSDANGTGAP